MDVDTSDSQLVEQPVEQPNKPRKKFAAIDDVVLLRAVNAYRPWRAPVGTSNRIMKVFDDIAAQCEADPEFMVDKQGAALRTRFNTLVREYKYKNDQCRSMRKSGTVEQYEERERLLQDIIAQMGDWQEQINAEKGGRDAKQQAIESSGELLRRLAMGELDDDSKSEGDGRSATDATSPRTRRLERTAQPNSEVLSTSGPRLNRRVQRNQRSPRESDSPSSWTCCPRVYSQSTRRTAASTSTRRSD